MFPPNSEFVIQDISSQPGPSGSNPSIITMLEHEINLPIDRILCPSLQCSVHDNILSGNIQPLIGHFELPMGELLYQRNQEYQHNIQKVVEIVEKLKKIVITG